jgi:hypothetical protein
MSWSNITELRGLVETEISDSTLQDILDIAQRYIESRIGVQSNSTYEIQTAHLFKSAALTLKRMKTNGELPYMSKLGSAQQYNEIDDIIKMYEKETSSLIRKSIFSVQKASTGLPYVRSRCNYVEDEENG